MPGLLIGKEREADNRLYRGTSPGNRTLNKRVMPNGRQYVCRLGYNTACNSYTDTNEIGRLSGSSLNRMESKRRKYERQLVYEDAKKEAAKYCPGTYQYDFAKSRYELLSTVKAIESKPKLKIPKASDRGDVRIHLFSKRSRGKVRDKCTALYRCFKQTGILATLTFIADVTDKTAVTILNKFFTQLRDDKGKIKYLWVAERQMKTTGRIHFHIILNQRLEIQRYNELWIRQQYASGLRYRDLTEDQAVELLNPFDVKKIKSMYGLSYYLTKYITKNGSEGFNCLAWHCSRSVSKLFTKTVVSRSTFTSVASWTNSRLDKKTGELVKGKNIAGAFYNLFFIENRLIYLPEMAELEQINCWILDGMLPDRIPLIEDVDISKFYNN